MHQAFDTARRISLVAAAVALTGAACPGDDPVSKCHVTDDNGYWFSRGFEFDVNLPDRCPVRIGTGRSMDQLFAGRVEAPSGQVASLAPLHVDFYNATNNPAGAQ